MVCISLKVNEQFLQTNEIIWPFLTSFWQSGDGLLQSLSATSRNIGLLKLSQLRLRNDIKGKGLASSVDSSIIRLRRRKSDHRWTLGEAF